MNRKKPLPRKYRPKGMDILFEDKFMIVINKHAGLLSVKANYEKEETAHNILTQYFRKGSAHSKKQLFVVHRLDRETSGVMIFAKSERFMDSLKDNWKEVKKTYLAVVHGKIEKKAGTVTSYLKEDKNYFVSSTKNPKQGKLAKTAYKVIKETPNFSTVEIDLLTGRKNQIRVHFSEMGNPLIGDTIYGKDKKIKTRLGLHAYKIAFTHPVTKEKMEFEAEIPEVFAKFMD